MAQVLHLTGPVLVGREEVRPQAWVVGGRVTYEPPSGEHEVTRVDGWVLPGLVDAHCHVGLDAHGAVDRETAQAQALGDREAGTLLIRDAGSPSDTRWVDDRPDLPRIIRAGRHIARTRRYIRNYAWEVEPEDLVERVRARGPGGRRVGQARRRLDRPRRRRPHAVLARRRPRRGRRRRPRGGRPGHRPLLRRAVARRPRRRRHRLRRARRGPGPRHDRGLRPAGHRHRADPGQHRHLPPDRRAGEGEVPRLPRPHARPARPPLRDDRRRARRGDRGLRRHRRRRLAAPRARRPGGRAADPVRFSALEALDAATWGARAWLGRPGIEEGEEADLVVYGADPAEDVGVLAPRRPSCCAEPSSAPDPPPLRARTRRCAPGGCPHRET